MKINEITIDQSRHLIKNYWGHPKKVADWLTMNNFVELGRGDYSIAYSKPGSNIVIKISKFEEDKAWLAFVNYTKSHPSQYFPKISRLVKYRDAINDKKIYFIAFMEKLEPIVDSTSSLALKVIDFLENQDDDFSFDDIDEYPESKQILLSAEERWPGFVHTTHNVFEDVPSFCYVDLHANNIMMRGNTPVIIDPWALR